MYLVCHIILLTLFFFGFSKCTFTLVTLQNATASNSGQLLVFMCLAVQLTLKQIVNFLI